MAFELSATPPARQRFRHPVFSTRSARQSHHGLFTGVLHRECEILVARVDIGFGVRQGPSRAAIPAMGAESRPNKRRADNFIWIIVRNDEFPQIDSRLAIGREAHHFPFITVGLKAKIRGELRVKKPERIWPRNRPDMFEPSIAPMP